jgi:hypothetical protein
MPAIEITKSEVPEDEELIVVQKNRDRDDFQKEMDAEVKTLVDGWLLAEGITDGTIPAEGKATLAENQRPKVRYHVNPKEKGPFKEVLRRAATLHKVEVVFLYPKGMHTEPVNERTGKAGVVVTVGPRSTKRNPTKDGETTATTTPETATPETPPAPPANPGPPPAAKPGPGTGGRGRRS